MSDDTEETVGGSGSDVRSNFRVRNSLNNGWLKLGDPGHQVFVRDADNLGWIQLVPGMFSIRDQTNSRWIDIFDFVEEDIDDPCDELWTNDSCSGASNSANYGSGDGTGSGGPAFDVIEGYPYGYDLPDAGLATFGRILTNEWPTGYSLRRPGLATSESYDNEAVAANNGYATYANPARAFTSIFAKGAAVTESIFILGETPGYCECLWSCYDSEGMSVDIYYLGQRVATSCGKQTGRGRLSFYFDPDLVDIESRVMVRVRCAEGGRWALQMRGPYDGSVSEVLGIALDQYNQYEVAEYPDLVNTSYIGTPVFPAPCHASVYVTEARVSGDGYFEYYHHMGELAGWVYLDFKSWDNADFVEVYHYGKRIATTLDPAQDRGFLKFYFDPTMNGCQDVMVRVTCANLGIGDKTSVYYAIWCPDTRGAREYRIPCGAYEIASSGHPTTEDCFTLTGNTDDLCGALINVNANSFDTTFTVFDEDDTQLDSITLAAGNSGTLEFWLPVGNTGRRVPYVQVSSAIGCDWTLFVSCPKQKPVIQVPDYNEQHIVELPTESADNFEWKRVWHNPIGAKVADYDWDYGYEYAVICAEPEPLFGTWQFSKLLDWSASIGSTELVKDVEAFLFKVRGGLSGSGDDREEIYQPLWFSLNRKTPYDRGNATLMTTWLVHIDKPRYATCKFTSDDDGRLNIYNSNPSAAQGTLVHSVTQTGGGRDNSKTIYFPAGYYLITISVWNKSETGYNNNPGYLGVVILQVPDPLFCTWNTDKLISWSAVHDGNNITSSVSVRALTQAESPSDFLDYRRIWLQNPDGSIWGKGNTTLNTTYLIYLEESTDYTMKIAGDDSVQLNMYKSNASGVQGASVLDFSRSGGESRSTRALTLSAGYYLIVARNYNRDKEDNFSQNPGYLGIALEYTSGSRKLEHKCAVGVLPLVEELCSAQDNYQRGPAIQVAAGEMRVAFKRARGNLVAHGTVEVAEVNRPNALLYQILRRRISKANYAGLKSNTWVQVYARDNFERSLSETIQRGYEYWALTDGSPIFHSRMYHLMKYWSTSAKEYFGENYVRTYFNNDDRSRYNVWASKDGINIDRVKASHCVAIYEIVAPYSGDYVLEGWGDDDPSFGIYIGPFKGMNTTPENDKTFNGRTCAWEGYTSIWTWYRNDDFNYIKTTIQLVAGQVYTIRLQCRNDNGGSALLGMCLTRPSAHGLSNQNYDDSPLTAHHLIMPVVSGSALSGPIDRIDALQDRSVVTVDGTSLTAFDASISEAWPALVRLYRRPLYLSANDQDLSGWSVEFIADSVAEAQEVLSLTRADDRDYFMYVTHDQTDVPVIGLDNSFTLGGAGGLQPLRMLNPAVISDIKKNIVANSVATLGTHRGVRAADEFVPNGKATGIVYVISRPCIVNV